MTYREYLNYYSILNVSPGASKDEIRSAYILLAKQYHPDKILDPAEKYETEAHFKRILEAYNELISVDEHYSEFMKSDFFKDDYKADYSKIYDFGDGAGSFLKFYFGQQELENKECNKQYTEDDFKSESIRVFEKYIKENNLSSFYIYECIRKNKTIVTVNDKINDLESYSSLLVKEVIYRRNIMKSKEYQVYIDKYSYFKNMDIFAILYVDTSYSKNKFDESVKYICKKICHKCQGSGCNECSSKGYIKFENIIQIQAPYVSKKTLLYEIPGAGNKSSIGDGKLFLKVIFSNEKLNEKGYKFKIRSKYDVVLDPILEVATFVETQFKILYNLMMQNKHLSALYFSIAMLIIIIICLVAFF